LAFRWYFQTWSGDKGGVGPTDIGANSDIDEARKKLCKTPESGIDNITLFYAENLSLSSAVASSECMRLAPQRINIADASNYISEIIWPLIESGLSDRINRDFMTAVESINDPNWQ
jgi:hypothetical protein